MCTDLCINLFLIGCVDSDCMALEEKFVGLCGVALTVFCKYVCGSCKANIGQGGGFEWDAKLQLLDLPGPKYWAMCYNLSGLQTSFLVYKLSLYTRFVVLLGE